MQIKEQEADSKGEVSANDVEPPDPIKPTVEAPRRYVLDSFAVFAYLNDEEGADQVEEILKGARAGEMEAYMHVVNLAEIFYLTRKSVV